MRPQWSTLNFKDALALTNRGPVVRRWPMVPGIDGAGEVLASDHPDWQAGDRFLHNGWGVGETHWGCLAQRARLHGDWLLRLPAPFGPRDAMVALSGEPYALDAVKAVDYATKAGAQVISITDSSLSPIAHNVAHVFVVPTAGPSFYQSLVAKMALLECFVCLMVARGGPRAADPGLSSSAGARNSLCGYRCAKIPFARRPQTGAQSRG